MQHATFDITLILLPSDTVLLASRPLFLLLALSLIAAGASGAAYADMDNPSPAKQVAEGTAPEDVACNGERILMLKTNGDPICALPSSADRLAAMEFATIVEAAPEDMEAAEPEDGEMAASEDAAEPESALVVSMTMFSDRFAVMKEDVRTLVTESVEAYESDGEGALDAITVSAEAYDAESPYVFVIDYDTLIILAHGFNATLVGTMSSALDDGEKTYDEIKAELGEDGETWVMYPFTNPATGEMQTKKSYLALHGNHIFASGFYLNDLEAEMIVAMWVANSAAGLYDEHGTDSFSMITDAAEDYVPGATYPFVVDVEAGVVVAHGADAARVGGVSVSVTDSNKPLELIQAESELNGGAWVTYTFTNFETQAEEIKLSWLAIRDGYAFGAGFYPDEFQTKKINAIMSTDNALAMYAEGGQDAFAEITALSVEEEWYPFVMDSETNTEVADGSILDRTGQKIWESYQMSAAIRDSKDAFDAGQGVFGKYVFLNPETGEQQAKKAWFIMHDGYTFGAGFYLTDKYAKKTEVMWSVGTAVEMYKELGMDATFAAIDAMNTDYPSYPFVFDGALNIVAHGANTDIIGGYLFDLVGSPDKDADQLMEELSGDGDQAWMRYTFVNPETGEDAEKVVLLEMHDGYIFAAGYYMEPEPPMAEVSFDDAEQAWLEDHPVITVAYDPAWPPYEYVDDEGSLAGVSGAIAGALEGMTGSQFVEADPAIASWNDALDRMKDGTADVLFVVENTAERDEYMDFTEPWITIPISIITLEENADAITSENLADYGVVTVDGYAVESWLDENMPAVEYESASSAQDALTMVSDGSADAFLDVWEVARYVAASNGIENLAEAGTIADEYALSIGYTEGDDTLGGMLQKMLDAMSQGEIERIVNEATS